MKEHILIYRKFDFSGFIVFSWGAGDIKLNRPQF